MFIIYFFIQFYSVKVWSEELAIEEYCFQSEAISLRVREQIKLITLPVDKIQAEGKCFRVATAPRRRELIQNFIRRLEPSVAIPYSSAEIKREPCRLKVEKVRQLLNQNNQGSIQISNDAVNPNINSGNTNQEARESMTIQTIKDFELTANFRTIKGECRFVSPDRYDINLEVRQDPAPLTPPLPPGTVVQIPTSELTKERPSSVLKTSLQLNRGQRIELGAIINQANEKIKELSLDPSLRAGDKKMQNSELIYLELD